MFFQLHVQHVSLIKFTLDVLLLILLSMLVHQLLITCPSKCSQGILGNKTNVTHPFCVECHVSVCPDMSIAFVRMAARIFFLAFELPPLHMTVKNESGCHKINNGKFLVTIGLATKSFRLPMD